MSGKMSSLKWIGAIRKLLPKALLKRLRMGVTYKDEAIGDIAERIETIFKALTMEEKEKKKSLLGKYYDTSPRGGHTGEPASSSTPTTDSKRAAESMEPSAAAKLLRKARNPQLHVYFFHLVSQL